MGAYENFRESIQMRIEKGDKDAISYLEAFDNGYKLGLQRAAKETNSAEDYITNQESIPTQTNGDESITIYIYSESGGNPDWADSGSNEL